MGNNIFTVDEANKLIPKLSEQMKSVFFLNGRIKLITGDVKDLIELWGEDLFDRRHVDHEYYKGLIRKRKEFVQVLQDAIEGVQKHGCVVKDVENGLVDFYSEKDGEPVFLCWKYGEPEIVYWHPVNGGFANRRHVREFAKKAA